MSTGGKGQKAEINVTPMIDVLLVLIIIFMVITPTESRGLNALVPQPSSEPVTTTMPHEIVITIAKDGAIEINHQPTGLAALADRLAPLRGVTDHIFIRGDRELEYQSVAQVIDIARGAGWDRVGLMTR